jgi:hypothetical protein
MGKYSGGRYVVTKIEGRKATLEGWEDPADIQHMEFPEKLPANWPEIKIGLQLTRTVHTSKGRLSGERSERSSWMPAKVQKRDRFIPLSSTLTSRAAK